LKEDRSSLQNPRGPKEDRSSLQYPRGPKEERSRIKHFLQEQNRVKLFPLEGRASPKRTTLLARAMLSEKPGGPGGLFHI